MDHGLSTPGDRLRGPRHRQDLTARQEQILDRLEEIVVGEGFRHLTLQDLTSELRCSRTILYALAPTKDELALLVIDRFFTRMGWEINEAVSKAATPRDRLAAALDTLALLVEPASKRFFEDIRQYAPANALHLRHSNIAIAKLRSIIAAGTEEGAFNPVDALFAAEVLGLVVAGISDGSLLDRTDLTSSEAVAHLSHMLFDGLISNESPNHGRLATRKRS